MNHSSFVVSRYVNRTGVSSWRVSGWLHGLRIRKNFKSREEAGAEKAVLEIKALQAASGIHATTTCLTEDQLKDAEASCRRLIGSPLSLSACVDYAIANYREPKPQTPLSVAVTEYLAKKTREQEQDLISTPQLKTIQNHLVVLQKHFPNAAVSDLTAQQLIAYCQAGNPSLKTYNNRRGVILGLP